MSRKRSTVLSGNCSSNRGTLPGLPADPQKISRDSEGPYITGRQAKKWYSVSPEMLLWWRKRPCSFLDGRTVKSRRCRTCGKRKEYEYLEKDVKQICERRYNPIRPQGVFQHSDGIYLTASEAKFRYAIPPKSLYKWCKKPCCYLDGQTIHRRFEKRIVDGRGRRVVSVFLERDLKDIAKRRRKPAKPQGVFRNSQGTWLTGAEAERQYSISADCLWWWHKNPCSYLDGQTIDSHIWRRPPNAKGRRFVRVYLEDDVKRIAKARRKPAKAQSVFQDSEGTWLTGPEAKRRYKVSPQSLWKWHKKPCRYLDGETIHSCKKERPPGDKGRRFVRVYLEDDVKRIAKGQRAESQSKYAEYQQKWPCESYEEEFRRLHDEQGLSHNKIGVQRGVFPIEVSNSIWRGRVEHDPSGTLKAIRKDSKMQLARRASVLHHNQGMDTESVAQALKTEKPVWKYRSNGQVHRMFRRGRFVRALERRAKELIAEAKDRSQANGNGTGRPGSGALTSPAGGKQETSAAARSRRKNKRRKKRRGPYKTEFDPAADKKLYDDWKAAKATGTRRIGDFARDRGLDELEVQETLERERGRRRRERLVSVPPDNSQTRQ